MNNERKYEPIKESRGWYYVEYRPLDRGSKHAILNLVITEDANTSDVANAMEKEAKIWLGLYPVPLLVSAFDNADSIYNLHGTRQNDHLIGFINQDNKICLHWESINYEEIPNNALNKEYVDTLYSNLGYKTYDELDNERKKRQKNIKSGWFIFLIWVAVIPAIWAILEYSSNLLSIIALLYSLYMAIRKGLELIGKWPKSKREKEQEIENRLKNHYYYHCQMNPEGFNRLKLENLTNLTKARIEKEAESLKNNSHLA
ncbi:MAG: hypothetical protein WA109_09345 [Bellilinea sp.]